MAEPGGDSQRARVRVTAEGSRDASEEITADLVVAADGARSAARAALFPDHPGPVYAGFTAWRLLTAPGTAEALGMPDSAETWGPGGVFGLMRLADDAVYAYATDAVPPGGRNDDEREALLARFAYWHAPIPALLKTADPEAVLRNDVWHLPVPPPRSHRGRVALLGDAAHAMTPSLGQGACQAVEDAVTLAHAVRRGDHGVPTALTTYSAARSPRTADIVRQSARAGHLTHMRSGPGLALRDAALATVGRTAPGLFYGMLRATFSWRPPAEAPE